MKLEELYEGLLEEGISPVVYHATTIESGLKMLKSNSIRSPAGQISFTRSLTGSYHIDNRLIGIIFELDGRKINQRYSGSPVGTEDFDDETVFRGKQNRQLEDRLYTGELKNLKSYITGIHLYMPKEILDSLSNFRGVKHYEDAFGANYLTNLADLRNLLIEVRTFYKGNITIHTSRTPFRGGNRITVNDLIKTVYNILDLRGKEFY